MHAYICLHACMYIADCYHKIILNGKHSLNSTIPSLLRSFITKDNCALRRIHAQVATIPISSNGDNAGTSSSIIKEDCNATSSAGGHNSVRLMSVIIA